MKILAIRLARFGDIVLLLPALCQLKSNFPGSHLTFLTDHRLVPLAEMCPAIDDIIAVDRIAMRDGARWASVKSMRHVLREVRRRKFELAIDFHGFRETNLLTWLSGSAKRVGLKRFDQSFLNFCFNLPPVPEDKDVHVKDMFSRVVQRFGNASLSAQPALMVPESSREWVKATLPQKPYAAVYVDAPTEKRIWPPENFAALADYLVSQMGLEVVAVTGRGGELLLNRIQAATRFPENVHAFSELTIPHLAALVESASLWISNDTGPMHLGPALGVPTLGLFSIGLPEHFRPTGIHDHFLWANPIEEISLADVIEWVRGIAVTDRPDLRR